MVSDRDYTVGLLCALPIELLAIREILDTKGERKFGDGFDNNLYLFGQVDSHNVVITCLPMGWKGGNPAAMVATRMMSRFPNIKIGLLVGIGGGVPSEKDDIRLGDVVVGKPEGRYGGVVQYDLGKSTTNGFECTGSLNAPPERLLALLNLMPRGPTKAPLNIYPEFDLLYKPDYDHVGGNTCNQCNEMQQVNRGPGNRQDGPHIFYGTIASGNSVIKNAAVRDELGKKHGVLCFEMEAAGLMNSSFPCLTIRGISDYADSHKNDKWQDYAAATAAQFAKDFLKEFPKDDKFVSVQDCCLESLLLDDSLNRMKNGSEPGENTCKWIERHPKFQGWMDASGPKTLLVSGKPGCGKSVLAEYVRTLVQKNLDRKPGNGVLASFFNNREKSSEQFTARILRALLYQIFKNSPSIIPQSSLMEEYMKLRGSKTEWPLIVLKSLFLSLRGTNVGFTFYLVIDSLEPGYHEITDLLLQIMRNNPCKFKVFLTSRSSEVSLRSFSDSQYSRIFLESDDSQHIRGDIEKYVSNKANYFMEHLEDPDKEGLQAIIDKLINQSNDVFLWVDVSLKILEEKLIYGIAVPDWVQSLPDKMPEMVELYEKLLTHLPEQYTRTRKIMLQWVVFAERPLKEKEFQIAVDISENKPLRTIGHKTFQKRVNSHCGGLVEITEQQIEGHPERFVRLIHHSANGYLRDWLLKENNSQASVHYELAMTCLTYLGMIKQATGGTVQSTEYEGLVKTHGFLRYAALYWSKHLNMGIVDFAHITEELVGKIKDLGSLPVQVSRFERHLDYSPEVQILHIVSELGHENVVKLLLQNGAEADAKDNHGRTPLYIAAREDHQAVIDILVNDWRANKEATNDSHQTLLHQAANEGSRKAVDQLIRIRANVNAIDQDGLAPLYIAAEMDHGAIVHLLIKKEAKIEPILLHKAVERGSKIAAELLITAGADIDAKEDSSGGTPLHKAVTRTIDFVEILINNGAALDEKDKEGETPLHKAVTRTRDFVEILINNGAALDEKDNEGKTPLHKAVTRTRDIVEILINNGAALDKKDNEGKTPLHTVIGSDDAVDIVELLVESGASTTTRDKYRQTLLHAAGSKGCIHLLNILLKHKGSGKNARDRDGQTPLHVAATNGHLEFAKLLVARGADMEVKDKDGQTPLHRAARFGKGEIARLLVLKGANKSAVDFNLQTPLHLATNLNHNNTISVLLDHKVAPPLLLHTAMGYFHAYTFIEDSACFKSLDSEGRHKEAQKAVDNAKRVAFEWPVEDHIPGLIKLALYDIVILCDDSGSMDKYGRKELLKETLTRVAEFATVLNPTGISLRFLNDSCKGHSLDNLTTDNINEAMDKIVCHGETKLGTTLKEKVVQPRVIERKGKLEKPLIVVIITDGMPDGENERSLRETILDCQKNVKDKGVVIFLVSQIGNDANATKFLGGLESDNEIKDMVFCSKKKLDDLKEFAQKNSTGSDKDKIYTALLIKLFSTTLTERTK